MIVLVEILLEYVRFCGLWFNYFVCYHETPESQSNFCFQKIYPRYYDTPNTEKKRPKVSGYDILGGGFKDLFLTPYLGK